MGNEQKNNLPGTTPNPASKPVLIGVLLNSKDIVYSSQPGAVRLKMLVKAGNQAGASLYLFSLKEVDYATCTIKGTYFEPCRGHWANKPFAFPDVLYIRSGAPECCAKELRRFLRAAEAHGTRVVNNLPAFDKWEVYRVLSRHAGIRPHLPDTRLCRKGSPGLMFTLRRMLRDYGSVYLKACRGRRGQQVMRITRMPNGHLECCYFLGRPTVHWVPCSSFYRLQHLVDRFFTGSCLIAQQPIDLIELDERKVDLRAEVQRNGKGELEVVAVPVRVGQKKSPITTHASSYRFEDFFKEAMGYSEADLEGLKNEIDALLFSIYEILEAHYGSFGEMGIDLGLDKGGRLWFIECNAQSAKVSLINAYHDSTVARAFSNPLEYALYIARAE